MANRDGSVGQLALQAGMFMCESDVSDHRLGKRQGSKHVRWDGPWVREDDFFSPERGKKGEHDRIQVSARALRL